MPRSEEVVETPAKVKARKAAEAAAKAKADKIKAIAVEGVLIANSL